MVCVTGHHTMSWRLIEIEGEGGFEVGDMVGVVVVVRRLCGMLWMLDDVEEKEDDPVEEGILLTHL